MDSNNSDVSCTYKYYVKNDLKAFKITLKDNEIEEADLNEIVRAHFPETVQGETLFLFIRPVIYNRYKISELPPLIDASESI